MLRTPADLTRSDMRAVIRDLRLLYRRRKRRSASQRQLDLATVEGIGWGQQVIGFSIGEKERGNAATGELAARFYVRRKIGRARLGGSAIPPAIQLVTPQGPRQLLTDVIEVRDLPSLHRDIPAGAPLGHVSGLTNGTLGLAVTDGAGNVFALTCRHVAGPWWQNPANSAMESPPDGNGVPGPNRVGAVYAYTTLRPTGNQCDAALVSPDEGIRLTNGPLGNPVAFGVSQATDLIDSEGPSIRIWTPRGWLDGVGQSLATHIDMEFLGRAFSFENVGEVALTTPAFEGDSGAAVLNAATRVVIGIHFAGVSGTGRAFFIPAQNIVRAFPGIRPGGV